MTQQHRVVIAGGGRVGVEVADLLQYHDHAPVLIERDVNRSGELSQSDIGTVVQGDATNPETLDGAGVDQSQTIAALTGDGDRNIRICAEARSMAPGIHTIARAHRPGAAGKQTANEFIDTVVYPERIGARSVVEEVLGTETIVPDEGAAGLEFVVHTVADEAPIAGQRLGEIELPSGCRVVSDVTRSTVVTAETTIQSGMEYLLAVEDDHDEKLRQLFETDP